MSDNPDRPIEKIKKESRKHPRIAVYLNVDSKKIFKLKDHTICSYNLSFGGMMLVATPPMKGELEIGEKINISFVIEIKSGFVKIPSQVVWVKEKVLTPEKEIATCIGIKFLDLQDEVRNMINSFISGKDTNIEVKTTKVTCRSCIYFKENVGSKYAYCKLHRITILNTDENLTLSFNQIYTHPCKDHKVQK